MMVGQQLYSSAIAPKRLNMDLSLHSMLHVLSVPPFEKITLFQLFSDAAEDSSMTGDGDQLNLQWSVLDTSVYE
jgi:hypothetical protein